ncbi:MAG: hypothetical protein ABIJ09_01345 [Pseudomonadota bacterium]
MIKLAVGFVAGFGLALGLVYLNVLTPGAVRSVAANPQQGVNQVADNMVQQVKEGAKNLRTNGEAAAMVTGKTTQEAVCRREGLSTRHVCRTREGTIYRVMGDEVVLYKGDLATLDPDLSDWAKQAFDEILSAAAKEARPAPAPAK